jgi:hypothetical protein
MRHKYKMLDGKPHGKKPHGKETGGWEDKKKFWGKESCKVMLDSFG